MRGFFNSALTLLTVLVLAQGCVAPEYYDARTMAPLLTYWGFTIRKPADPRWIGRTVEQVPTQASFSLSKGPLSQSHSVYLEVRHQRLEERPATPEAFRELVERTMTASSPRFTPVSARFVPGQRDGAWIVEFDVHVKDLQPANWPAPLSMIQVGWVAHHPSWGDRAIMAEYSERGTDEDLAEGLEALGRDFLDGVRLVHGPGKPFPGRGASVERD